MPFTLDARSGSTGFVSAAEMLDRARERREQGEASRAVFDASVAAEIASAIAPEPETLYHSLACVGRLHMSCAAWDRAAGWYEQALDVAKTHDLKQWIGPAHHDLMAAAKERHDERGFRLHVDAAMRAYERHPRLMCFVADVNYYTGKPEDRLRLYRPVEHIPEERTRRYALVNQLGAYAEMGRADRALRLWRAIESEGWTAGEGVALALTEAAEGLAALGCREEKEKAAWSALQMADERKEDAVAERARVLL